MNIDTAKKREKLLDMFKGICELNSYRQIIPQEKTPRKHILENILENIKEKGEYYLYGSTYNPSENCELAILLKERKNVYDIAELLNAAYKIYFFLNFEEIQVHIKNISKEGKLTKDILEELDNLGIPATENNDIDIDKKYDIDIAYDITANGRKVAHGGMDADSGVAYIVLNSNESMDEIDIDKNLESSGIYIFPQSREVFSDCLLISSELKDCGFKTKTDYSLNKENIKSIDALKYHTLISFDIDDIKKYSVKIKDLNTLEEHTTSLENIVEELSLIL